jgi:hypothetical protein
MVFDTEHKKNLGVISFLGWLVFFTFVGALDWYTTGLTLVIFLGVWEYTRHQEGGN